MLAAFTMTVFMKLQHTMNAQIDTDQNEQDGAYMTEPFLKGLHAAGEFADTDRTVTYQPCNQHDRKTGT